MSGTPSCACLPKFYIDGSSWSSYACRQLREVVQWNREEDGSALLVVSSPIHSTGDKPTHSWQCYYVFLCDIITVDVCEFTNNMSSLKICWSWLCFQFSYDYYSMCTCINILHASISISQTCLMSPHVTKSPRPSPSIFAYCKWSNTGGGNGLGTGLYKIMLPDDYRTSCEISDADASSIPALLFSYTRLAFSQNLVWKFVNWWVWLQSYLLGIVEIVGAVSSPTICAYQETEIGLKQEPIKRRSV